MAKGVLRIKILGDAGDLDKVLAGVGTRLGKFGKTLAGIGAVVGPAIGVIGGFADAGLKAGLAIDKAFDTIRVGTGATGKQLADLQNSFRTVFANVPESAENVGQAIADLNTRLGLTGPNLETVAKKVLTLSKITGEDLGGVLEGTARLFQNWDIAAKDQGTALDYLFKVSQNTGIGISKLSDSVTQFGPTLRQLGFSFSESAALIGQFEKQGVNIEAVMAGMKRGLANFAKAGEAPAETLRRVMQAIKDAGSAADANQIAIKAFGTRAGPEMAAAIREGRLSIDELLKTIEQSPETIEKAAQATYDFGERWEMFKNKLTLALEPLGVKLMDILDRVIDKFNDVIPAVEKIASSMADAFVEAMPLIEQVIDQVVKILPGLVDLFKPMIPVVGQVIGLIVSTFSQLVPVITQVVSSIVPIIGKLAEIFAQFMAALMPLIGQILTPLVQAFAAVGQAVMQLLSVVGPALMQIATQILQTLGPPLVSLITTVANTFADFVQQVAPLLAQFVPMLAQTFSQMFATVAPILTDFLALAQQVFGMIAESILPLVADALNALMPVVQKVLGFIQDLWSRWGDDIMRVTSTVFGAVKNIIEPAIRAVQAIINTVLAIIRGDWEAAWTNIKEYFGAIWDTIKAIFEGAWNVMKAVVQSALGIIKDLIVSVWGFLKGWLEEIWGDIKGAFQGMWNGMKTAWETAKAWIASIPGKIKEFFAGAASWLVDKGRDILNGLWNGLKEVWNSVSGWFQELPGKIKGAFAGAGNWLYDIGRDIVNGLWRGMQWIWDKIEGFASSVGSKIKGAFKRVFGIGSPSKVFLEYGQNLMQGLALGITDAADLAAKALDSVKLEPPALLELAPRLGGGATAGVSSGGTVVNVGPIYITGARAEGEQAGDALLARLAALGVTA